MSFSSESDRPVNVGKTSSEYNSDDLVSRNDYRLFELNSETKEEIDEQREEKYFPDLSDDANSQVESGDGDEDDDIESIVDSDEDEPDANETESFTGVESQEHVGRLKSAKYYRVDGDEDIWRCRLCSFQTDVYSRIRYHTKIGHLQPDEKPWKCKICSKKFSSPSSLTTHKKVHLDAAEFYCAICKMFFRLKHHLKRHELVVHRVRDPTAAAPKPTGKKTPGHFECDVCHKIFSTKQSKSRHQITMHRQRRDVEPNNTVVGNDGNSERVSCPTCDKTFKNSSALKVHQAKAHGESKSMKDAKHVCEHCGRGFAAKSDLRYHLMRHFGKFPVSCDACGAGFPTQSELRKHNKNSIRCNMVRAKAAD